MECWLIHVHGHVQGVGFRYFVQSEAFTQDISGWVKNNDDGTVSIYAIGSTSALNAFRSAVKAGPRFSRVTEVIVEKQKQWTPLSSFKITY
ncbi:acylphosphatase [Evansella caseinilytica]|uniref:Acylphosphatase n=1 Tax=Evansella caseinilytica TaxID=1503961 RepID=A0A1H3H854_9BACI|nr:acylphosphatase [Evansella caseinilytica]SDY11692.1 acylphosphatase [Evansella caseinilytica]